MPTHDIVLQDSGAIRVKTGISLAGVSTGVHDYATATAAGAVGTLDFGGTSWLYITMTENLTGAFANPPLNVPTLAANQLQGFLGIVFIQDETGGRTGDLNALFGNYTRDGVSVIDPNAGQPTLVIMTMKRVGDATTYSVSMPPGFDGAQIARGTVPAARLPLGTAAAAGILQLGSSSAAAAAGNHTHQWQDTRQFRIRGSDGGALTAGDVDIYSDMYGGGEIVRLAKVATDVGTLTLTMKINATPVTGISLAVTTTPSGDSTATAAKTWVDRNSIRFTIASPAGGATEINGSLHLLHTGLPLT